MLGNTMNEREGFIQALENDPYDDTTRKVFADWLDDHDEPEFAEYQRNWNKVDYINAKDHLLEYARDCEIELNELLSGALEHLETGRNTIHLPFDTPDICYRRKEFWKCFYDYTGVVVPEDYRDNGFIACGC